MKTFDVDIYTADRKIGEFTDLDFDTVADCEAFCRDSLSPDLKIIIWDVTDSD